MNTAFYPIFAHPVRRPWVAGICFILFGVACAHAQSSKRLTRPEIFLDPQVRSSGVSGQSSVTTVTVPDANTTKRGIYGFTLGERRDHPCFIRVHRESISDHRTDFSRATDRCGNKGPTKRSLAFVGWNDNQLQTWLDASGNAATSAARSYFVRGVEVCMNKRRVKGLRVFSTKVHGDGRIATPSNDGFTPPLNYAGFVVGGAPTQAPPSDPLPNTEPPGAETFYEPESSGMRRPNCKVGDWKVPRFCAEGEVAVAARVHITNSGTPRDITGIELLCRKVRRRIARRLDPNAPLPGKNPRK